MIIFGLVWFLLKKITKLKLKKNRNQTKTGSNRPVSVWFGSVRFLGKKRFKPVWLSFSGLAQFFPVLARFFPVWLGFCSVFQFGSVLTRFSLIFFLIFFFSFGSVRFLIFYL
jgi:hypothetical protein